LNIGVNLASSVVVGGLGNDRLTGSAGRDILIGGKGRDQISGGAQDDILIGGTTIHDGNLASLDALMAKWGGRGTYAARRNALSRTTGAGPKLNAKTVFDDALADTLSGQGGSDWFFARTVGTIAVRDKVIKTTGETVTLPG
jgi:Ca2+-binding RTX toxin-like protein